MMTTLFEYLYRDAGNFKAFGCVALAGELTQAEQIVARACFDADGLFVAEQIDVPPLYAELYKWSGGPTSSDHCWHEFVGFRVVSPASLSPDTYEWGSATQFLRRICSVFEWDGSLSPHFLYGGMRLDGDETSVH